MKVAVIGIGESMRGDDAAGIEAVGLWERLHAATSGQPGIRVQLIQQSGLELLDALKDVDAAVLVDALQPGSQPGSVRILEIGELDASATNGGSSHGWGVAETLALGRTLRTLRRDIAVRCVGIEAQQLGIGTGLSESVLRALPAACTSIQVEVLRLLQA